MSNSNDGNEPGEKPENAFVRSGPEGPELIVDRKVLNELRVAYNDALTDKVDQFNFRGHDLIVPYAKYLIEYLDTRIA